MALVPALRPPEAPPSPSPSPQPAAAAPKASKPARTPPRDVETLPAADKAAAFAEAEVGEGELAGAATAGSGGGGRGCDMTRLLQNALRKDPQVQAALAEADRGKALRVWNGDWVLHPGQEGNGLAAVREAIMWEVGFAPIACRSERIHGLVLLSLADRPGAARIVVGAGEWRWSDLLFAHSGGG